MSRNLIPTRHRGSKKEGKKASRSNKHGSDRRGPEAEHPYSVDASGPAIAYERSYDDDAYEDSLAQVQTDANATAIQDEEDSFHKQLQGAINKSRAAMPSYPYGGGGGESSTMPPEQQQADDDGFGQENINPPYVHSAGMYEQFQATEDEAEEDYQAAGLGGGDYLNTYSVTAETGGGEALEPPTSLTEYTDEGHATMLVSFARKNRGHKTVAAYLDRACHVGNLISQDLIHDLGRQDERRANTRAGEMVATDFGKVQLHDHKITLQWKRVDSDGRTKLATQETEFFAFKSKTNPEFEFDVSFRLPWNAPGEFSLQKDKKTQRRTIGGRYAGALN